MERTAQQYRQVIARCRSLFLQKAQDYGPSWLILRLPSVTDQILIKAERCRTLQETGVNRVGESEAAEFVGIVNYCAIALMLIERAEMQEHFDYQNHTTLSERYDAAIARAWATLERKNQDYGEAWRKMRVSSMTDLILMKIQRLKQIEDNQGRVQVSEGPEASYIDMLNYAVFCLIRQEEEGGA